MGAGDDGAAVLPAGRRAGITFWDTANVYQLGASEESSAAQSAVHPPRGHRAGHQSAREDARRPGRQGLSRKAILEQVDAPCAAGTDYIDLYQIHRFDPETPVEETMEALHDLVKAGKVRYLGAPPCTPGSSRSSSTPPS